MGVDYYSFTQEVFSSTILHKGLGSKNPRGKIILNLISSMDRWPKTTHLFPSLRLLTKRNVTLVSLKLKPPNKLPCHLRASEKRMGLGFESFYHARLHQIFV